ncbi:MULTISPECIES: LacI family DNA-binding transcriptional regulator [Leuconostoc]|nr:MULTISPECIES: LacI family DNA-binding transcriptional regulator [Leuconostoc]API73010.1 transcriptional regulator [Leuconostoc suionicum]MBE4728241.1 LacI family DNA-binding transcriptional regulator [Leuconostoc suionicum]MCT4402126.1 LacI family DNA-binding transcriptional regulator [Leuconostoc suionicum]MDC2805284.1 LacI family DNA-binding transcriptional regulator [Leuconostoc suionicum]MDC2822796.1 LacI family DNA-binding transcriptional regulator [Leuconostoc suionicum]
MNDVASLAGVSRGSVSNYINGKKTKPNTQKKIAQAIAELNYVPNAMARSLKTSQSNFVVFIIPTVNSPFFSELSYYMQQELQKNGYKMILCNSNNRSEDEIEYIQMANTQKVAGLITMSYADAANLIATDIPLVSIEKKVSDQVPLVVSDNYSGGQLAGKTLVNSGAKRLLFISKAPVRNISAIREEGFFDYCREHNITVDRFVTRDIANFVDDFATFINENTINTTFNYDGIFSDSDEFASDFYFLLTQKGINVPKDVQIIGFDGARIYSRQQIFLSSIKQPTAEIAKSSVEKLLSQMNQKNTTASHNHVTLPVHFVKGMTTL